MNRPLKIGASTVAMLLSSAHLLAQDYSVERVREAVDSAMNAAIESGQIAGGTVAVVHGRDTVLLRAYGYADLEYMVPTPADAIYEIGSVTKQFTAVAILQLAERGLLELDTDFKHYLPDYPGESKGATVRQLMNHTSGIKGYTEIPGLMNEFVTLDLPVDSLVRLFASAPRDFDPGEAMIYNNSAYFLLGLIVEEVTGRTYADYVQEELLRPLGMTNSGYCSHNAIVRNRAHGYDAGPDGLVRKAYLNHKWPYSAGSLCSTVRDLLAWNHTLHVLQGDGLISPESYRQLTTPGTLSDGTPLRYAMGLSVFDKRGHRVIAHGGGIPGFLSNVEHYPDLDITIVVLFNTAGPPGPGAIVNLVGETMLNETAHDPVRPPPRELDRFTGTYRGAGRGMEFVVTIAEADDGLTAQVLSGEVARLEYVGNATFERGPNRLVFERRDDGEMLLKFDAIGGLYVLRRDRD